MRTSSQTKFSSKLFPSKFDLRAGRYSNTAKVRLVWFWEAMNINKGGELMSVDMLLIHENARRKKISKRMNILQDIVTGCNRITGKAALLDEIIEYFFSMKLATINSSLESNPDAALSIELAYGKDFCHEYIIMPRTCLDSQTRNLPQVMDLFKPSNFQMGFGDVQQQSSNNSCSEATLQMKPQPCEEGVLFCFNNMP
ncbi:hypothetical protein HID58_039144 [Brassica napus]|uniref:BHLH domain-containing protein n=1 Tax=Brassica napus TaxID=3708 RepID=A0ABQ8BR77_BRANA|nr:hypothetical protein HID58_039144 [Brassica napus]